MFPVVLDIITLRVVLIGNAEATLRRLHLLDEAGAVNVVVYAPRPSNALREKAASRLQERLPENEDLATVPVVMIADFDEDETARLAQMARRCGALVNAEDKRPWCDFHVPAIVRRGDLLFTVSTNGKSPRLARRLRQILEEWFTDVWALRLDTIGRMREEWKKEGASFSELAARTDAVLEKEGWLVDLKERGAEK